MNTCDPAKGSDRCSAAPSHHPDCATHLGGLRCTCAIVQHDEECEIDSGAVGYDGIYCDCVERGQQESVEGAGVAVDGAEPESTSPNPDAASLAELTIPQKVIVNYETYLPEWKIVAGLAALYREGESVAVARLCDDFLDPSGRLLGIVREQAAS